MKKNSIVNIEKKQGISFWIVVMAIYLWLGHQLINSSIWVDEASTLELMQHSYAEIINLTAMDVHPPLYYLGGKFVVNLLSQIVRGGDIVILAKWISYLPFVAGIAICAFIIEKNVGRFWSVIYLLFILIMPEMLHYSFEIRMYSWGMLFVLCAYMSVRPLIVEASLSIGKWYLFIMWSLLAAYTHYYACVAVGFLYLILLWDTFHDRKRRKLWIKCMCITVLGYLPWLWAFAKTIKIVSVNNHISSLDWRTVLGYFMCIVKPSVNNRYWGYGMTVVSYLLIGILCIKTIMKKNMDEKNENAWRMIGIGMAFWVIGAGIIAALITGRLILTRHISVVMPCFWLSVCLMLANICNTYDKNKKIGYFILFVLISMNISNVTNILNMEKRYRDNLNYIISSGIFDEPDQVKIVTLFSSITDKVNRESHLNETISTQFNVDTYLYEKNEWDWAMLVYHNIHDNCETAEVAQMINDGYRVYLLADKLDIEKCDLLQNKAFLMKREGTYFLEEYEFDIYKLELQK